MLPIPSRTAPATTASATSGPFKGKWSMGESVMDLDFDGKTIDGQDADFNDIKCYGSIFISFNNASQIDNGSITAWKADGNKATVTFIDSRDANIYSAVLTYNPNDKSITISQVKLLTEDAKAGTFVADGMIFTK